MYLELIRSSPTALLKVPQSYNPVASFRRPGQTEGYAAAWKGKFLGDRGIADSYAHSQLRWRYTRTAMIALSGLGSRKVIPRGDRSSIEKQESNYDGVPTRYLEICRTDGTVTLTSIRTDARDSVPTEGSFPPFFRPMALRLGMK